ncbi:Beta-lactamase associated winged helix domain [Popillia japonica]|uniref:Beta-lactamase-like protein 2 homolog n=1 Tax=Popillia japonica TaxID=7064 RepID=A0AAW1MBJ4_POPJA
MVFLNLARMAAVIPNVTKLTSRVIRVLGCNPSPMTLQGTNTYIIGTGKRRILIDTGDADIPQYINHLKSVLKHEDINLAHIFITHWHHDHIGGINDVMELKDYTKYCQVWKYPREDQKDELPVNIKFEYLKDGQEFSVEGATVRIVYTPGHSTDHVVLQLIEENAIFSGDCILECILDLKPEIIYPAHGNVIHNPQEKIQFYIDHRKQREEQILNVLKTHSDKTFSPMDIVAQIYINTPKNLYEAAAYNVEHHLTKLLKENKIKQIDSTFQYIAPHKI